MKKSVMLIIILGSVYFSAVVHAATYDTTGKWNYTASSFYNNCGEPNPPSESGTVVLVQSNNTFFLVFTDKTVSGSVNGTTYTTFADRYWEDGGWTTETRVLTMASPASASGNSSWSWTDGSFTCSGGYTLNLNKQGQSPPAYDGDIVNSCV